MTLTFVLVACTFAAVVGALVACIDWWRDARLTVVPPVHRVRVPVAHVRPVPGARKRAA
jgi:hypothetical protein